MITKKHKHWGRPFKYLISWWLHDKETHCWHFIRRTHRSPTNSPHKLSIMWTVLWRFSSLLVWTSCWTNSWVVCDLRCLDAHVTSISCWNGHRLDDWLFCVVVIENGHTDSLARPSYEKADIRMTSISSGANFPLCHSLYPPINMV